MTFCIYKPSKRFLARIEALTGKKPDYSSPNDYLRVGKLAMFVGETGCSGTDYTAQGISTYRECNITDAHIRTALGVVKPLPTTRTKTKWALKNKGGAYLTPNLGTDTDIGQAMLYWSRQEAREEARDNRTYGWKVVRVSMQLTEVSS